MGLPDASQWHISGWRPPAVDEQWPLIDGLDAQPASVTEEINPRPGL